MDKSSSLSSDFSTTDHMEHVHRIDANRPVCGRDSPCPQQTTDTGRSDESIYVE